MGLKGTYAPYGRVITREELYQALFQDYGWFMEHGVMHMTSVYLYFSACTAQGQPRAIYNKDGGQVTGYDTAGCYRPIADKYTPELLIPTTTLRHH